jgi:glutamate-1-semialdehyde 2,1-aminomutase
VSRNSELFEKAKRFIPGGVNSPVRAFKTVGGIPPFIKRGKGCKIWDEDGNEYIDYVASWGPLILGHSDDEINDAAIEAIRNGSSFGAPTANEVTFAEKLCNHFDSIEMIRVVNSGTEATMASIRLARGFTERNKIVKMAGCYHGCVEALLVEAGSGIATFAIPGSPGITKGTTGDTLVVPYNDMDAVNKVFEAHGPDIAAIIVEPVPGNMGVMIPDKGYLEFLRKVTQNYGSLLIFDEVMSGFRVDHVGAQRKYNVKPDLTCLGKVIGGGFPVGAFGGRRDIMTLIAPSGPVYQAGTLSGNPVAISAGLATLSKLTEEIFNKIEQQAEILARGFREIASEAQVPLTVNRQGTMMTMFFTDKPVRCYKDAQNTETEKYNRYFKNMLSRGIALAPSAYEAGFVGLAHDDEVIEKTLKAHKESLWALRSNI